DNLEQTRMPGGSGASMGRRRPPSRTVCDRSRPCGPTPDESPSVAGFQPRRTVEQCQCHYDALVVIKGTYVADVEASFSGREVWGVHTNERKYSASVAADERLSS